MLLRSVTKHLKDQNWFAIWIDFLIVVVGVFIGIQVSNWNNGQKAALQEQLILKQLHTQFDVFIEETESALVAQKKSQNASNQLLSIIRENAEPKDTETFKQILQQVNSLWWTSRVPTTLIELVNAGRLYELKSPILRELLTKFYQDFQSHEIAAERTLVLITSPQNLYHQAVFYDMSESIKVTRYDWNIVLQLRPETQSVLIGKRIVSRKTQDLLSQARDIQVVIDEEIK
ncbi:hypothetical protein [Paraglaciecola hydrolytica]|uniref:Uncharacterized protein n=1 Tax=Paraglaciecola hydrolytica TaxID=1799789 RepID=A0A148KKU3_9ALTE|nr:hypothetical protein [Paraglaciecola hydrolytica]KXI26923.1 hypothetical protein AX660_02695 [Paraglaciecola hydrolytica]